jgi:23S rRNA pseudouridine1911/1915/1917 synthase
MNEPRIIRESSFYIVVDKPHNMHTAPLSAETDGTLFGWCARIYPEITAVRGRKSVEGGLLHRLDYETAGLVLIARTQAAYGFFAAAQDAGLFIKDYTAVTRAGPPDMLTVWYTKAVPVSASHVVSSGFRHYGPGRKLVKPELAAGQIPAGKRYDTQILEIKERGVNTEFHIRLARGFRHQIRAHLAWTGYPILNDACYGGVDTGGPLGLTAWRLAFPDPGSENKTRSVCVELSTDDMRHGLCGLREETARTFS